MESIGVRELRQHASRFLDRVSAGERLQITNHGQPVALLVPVSGESRTWDDLVARGLIVPGRGSVLDVVPPPAPKGSPTSEELLDEMRDER